MPGSKKGGDVAKTGCSAKGCGQPCAAALRGWRTIASGEMAKATLCQGSAETAMLSTIVPGSAASATLALAVGCAKLGTVFSMAPKAKATGSSADAASCGELGQYGVRSVSTSVT